MPSSPLAIVPELSRSFKYQEYSQYNRRSCHPQVDNSQEQQQDDVVGISKTTESFRCFEVRPSTNGIGMFATKPIAVGDIIIDSEEPIVATSMSLFPSMKVAAGGAARYFEDSEDDVKDHEKDIKKNGNQKEEPRNDRCILDSPFCQTCGTPIGNLRQDHLKAPLHLELPGIEKGDVGLAFSLDESHDEDGKEQDQENSEEVLDRKYRTLWSPHSKCVAWCSKDCWEKRCKMHSWVCLSDRRNWDQNVSQTEQNANEDYPAMKSRLQNFLEERDNPKIFELAIQAILLVLLLPRDEQPGRNACNEQNVKLPGSVSPDCVRHNYLWWEDYGSHPLWWTVGAAENRKDRFRRTQEFAALLRDWCKERITFMKEQRLGPRKRRRIHSKGSDVPFTEDMLLSSDGIDNLCSVNNIGALLGMLQCNVMEFSYPSPLQQYMEQAEEFIEEENLQCVELANVSKDHKDMHRQDRHEEGTATDQDDTIMHNALMDGCEWLRKNYLNDPEEDAQSKSGTCFDSPEPVVGSGLYPLLTLANHHCNPNASIEFLRESNRGSMVALRPIKSGEEICITYVPNGDHHASLPEDESEDGSTNGATNTCDHNGDYFRHFQPTRTWKWLNHHQAEDSDTDDEDCDTSHTFKSQEDHDSVGEVEENSTEESDDKEDQKPDQQSAPTDDLVDGGDPEQRARGLLEYGFVCKCTRCEYESIRHPNTALLHHAMTLQQKQSE